MSFADVWNPAYEGIPADSENISLGAGRIRDLKVNVRQRGGQDHSWGDTADNGRHNVITFNTAGSAPPGSSVNASLYAFVSAAATVDLFYQDTAGHTTQITGAGLVNGTFPPGTRLNFLQAAPPAGWTFVSGLGDRVIRMVDDGTGGALGGNWTITGVSTSGSLGSLSATSSSSGSTTGAFATDQHTLTTAEIPSHTHQVGVTINPFISVQAGTGQIVPNASGPGTSFPSDGGAVGGQGHAHMVSSAVPVAVSTTTTLGGAPGVTWSNDASWRPLYVAACMGQKN